MPFLGFRAHRPVLPFLWAQNSFAEIQVINVGDKIKLELRRGFGDAGCLLKREVLTADQFCSKAGMRLLDGDGVLCAIPVLLCPSAPGRGIWNDGGALPFREDGGLCPAMLQAVDRRAGMKHKPCPPLSSVVCGARGKEATGRSHFNKARRRKAVPRGHTPLWHRAVCAAAATKRGAAAGYCACAREGCDGSSG